MIGNQFQSHWHLTSAEFAVLEAAARKERALALGMFARAIRKALRRVFLLEGGLTVYVPSGKSHVSA
jgi:hypothetical protein